MVATVIVLQALEGLSDREAISALRRDIAKLLEARGFPPFSDEDIGRLHLLLYDLLYEGHEDTMRLP